MEGFARGSAVSNREVLPRQLTARKRLWAEGDATPHKSISPHPEISRHCALIRMSGALIMPNWITYSFLNCICSAHHLWLSFHALLQLRAVLCYDSALVPLHLLPIISWCFGTTQVWVHQESRMGDGSLGGYCRWKRTKNKKIRWKRWERSLCEKGHRLYLWSSRPGQSHHTFGNVEQKVIACRSGLLTLMAWRARTVHWQARLMHEVQCMHHLYG